MKMAKISLLICVCILAFGFVNGKVGRPGKAGGAGHEKVGFYELKNGKMSAKFTNWGATLVSLIVPDLHGKPTDVVLGYDTVEEYKNGKNYFGAIVGRVANRIKDATFKLDNTVYKLPPNEGKNILHGGVHGFSNVSWKVSRYNPHGPAPHIVFTYVSKDGDQGFPSDLRVIVSYTLQPDNQLSVVMKAKNLGKKATPVSLSQHAYWNLGGHNSGDILSEYLWLFGAFYTPVDSQLIPTGQKTYAVGTAYDFQTEPKLIKGRMHMISGTPYDNNYILDGEFNGKVKKAAILHDRNNGIKLEISTNQPGMQLYTGGMINNVKGKGGAVYKANAGLCLEPQFYPDFVNHPEWPQSIIRPGKRYLHNTVYKFSTGLKA